MEILEKLRQWLMGFPGWGDAPLAVDTTGSEPGSCGLFPLGQELLERREDVLGGSVCRWRMVFTLRRTAIRGDSGWLLAFQKWVQSQNEQRLCPVLGDEPAREQLRAEGGKLVAPAKAGTACYEVRLTAEFIKRHEVT